MSGYKFPGSLLDVCAALLVLLFTYTAINKLIDHDVFRIQLLPVSIRKGYREIIAWLIPIVELLIVFLLVIKKTRYWGFALSFGILSVFTVYLALGLLGKSELPCHCGGVINSLSWGQHIIFNLFFILISVLGLLLGRWDYRRVSTNSENDASKIILDQNRESTFTHSKI